MLEQAESRVHRQGQTKDVQIKFLYAKSTADKYLWRMILVKQDVLKEIGLDNDDLNEDFFALNHLDGQSEEDSEDTDEEIVNPKILVSF